MITMHRIGIAIINQNSREQPKQMIQPVESYESKKNSTSTPQGAEAQLDHKQEILLGTPPLLAAPPHLQA